MFVAAAQPGFTEVIAEQSAPTDVDKQLAVFHEVQKMMSRLKGVTDAHVTLMQLIPGCYYLITSVHAGACYSEYAGCNSRLRYDGTYVPLLMCVCDPISADGREFATPTRPICCSCKAVFRITVPKRFDTSLELAQRVTERLCYIDKFSNWSQHVQDIVGCTDLMINTCFGPMFYSPNEMMQIQEEKQCALKSTHPVTGFDPEKPLSLEEYVQFYVPEYQNVHPYYRDHFEKRIADNVLSGVPLVVDTSKIPTVDTQSELCNVEPSTSDTSMSM